VLSLVTFFAQAKKVTRAKRETLLLEDESRRAKSLGPRLRGDDGKSKIKSTPPQSSPALRAREEAKEEQVQVQKQEHEQNQDQDQDQDGSQLALG
jgi:hypothetical protein